MTTEYFKVRNGLSVGEDTFTVDASTGNVVVAGNLTVNGDTTTLNTTQLQIEDNKIILNKNVTDTPGLDAGIIVERGSSADSAINWNESTDKWEQDRGGVVTVIPINTTELAEGSNQYFTAQRAVDAVEAAGYATETQLATKLNTSDFTTTADTWLGTKSTTNLAEGTNLYYTDARVQAEIAGDNPGSFINLTASGDVELLTDTVIIGDDTVTGYQGLEFNTLGKTAHLVIDHTTGKLIYSRDNITWTPVAQSTTELAEGTNLYYTDARVGSYLSTNSYATQSYVGTQIANLVDSAPGTLDTLNELAAALGDDPNYATTITTALGTKLATADFTSTANTWLGTKTTDNLTEGSTNKYFSNTLARGALSAGTGVGYDSGTGIISIGQSVATGASPAFAGVTAGNLTVGVSTDNSIVSTDTNGSITLAPNGTGNVVNTFSDGGNLTNNRNYVHGAIRNSTTANIGDVWAANSTTAGGPLRGMSLDNSGNTAKNPGAVIRGYSGSAATGQRGRIVFEKARNTVASPQANSTGDILGSVEATGYTSTGWLNDNIAAVTPANMLFAAAEPWVSNTAIGTAFVMNLAPTSTTITGAGNLVQVINVTPQIAAHRSDATTFSQGKSGSTTYASLGLTGNSLIANNALNTCIRQGTANSTLPAFLIRYSRTDTTGSNDGDGTDFRMGTGGTSTTNNIARFDTQYRSSGLHDIGIAVSVDNFSGTDPTRTTNIYRGNAEKTVIRAMPTGGGGVGTASDIMEISDSKILNNRPHRSAVTTATVARGSTYTPAAGVNNYIEVTLTAGTDPTYINVDNLTVAGEGGHQAILIYNNSGSAVGNNDLVIRNNGTAINATNDTIANGARVIFTVYCVGNYASCEYMTAA
jgi:hypothetical protein